MAKTYRKIQQWDRWLAHYPGQTVFEAEHKYLSNALKQFLGKQALLIGTPYQHGLLKTSVISRQTLLSPLLGFGHPKDIRGIESELYDLPILSGSVDLVLLPHTLEYMDNPQKLLAEACRTVRPDGHIVICGFNPYSLWGVKKWWAHNKHTPWTGNFIHSSQIKKWLSFSDFKLMNQSMILFRPPMKHRGSYNNLKFMEWLGSKCWSPFGGVYMLVAQAKVIPLTPIKLSWKQKISDINLNPIGIPRPTIRERF
ncbi:MAG: class I SAM-dependent methyltransferase [Gammaproteobacteria bacterium]|nr:class I SAM-dependent methyltransferase [Gammaproteobacteria bacterium]